MSTNKLINGVEGQLTDWSQINWRQTSKAVRNLRQRIFRARKLGQWKQLHRLQKLLTKSRANLLLSIRQITQINDGKQTSGVDKEIINTPQQRVKLAQQWEMPKASPTKREYIPKSNGKKRPLGIPTVKDRVAQAIVKNTLEPEWEAEFEPNSYGFRPGRSCHDAIGQAFMRLQKGRDTWVLDADIKGFFDNVAHETILKNIGSHPSKKLIKEWLKAGFIDDGNYQLTETGTPQGGVISPLLANIGLHGLETFINQINPKLGIIRYADDFVLTAKSKEASEAVLIPLKQWLSTRGLELSAEKTRVVNIKDGFDFLGFNLRHYKVKLLIKPQKEKVLAYCKRIGQILSKMKACTQEEVIRKLNPILRGFANYYRGVVSKETFSYVKNRIWLYLWCWAKRRHPNKSKKWVKDRYFQRVQNVDWTFGCEVISRKGKKSTLYLYNIAATLIMRHIKVKGNASPDDQSLREYWEKRHQNQGKSHWELNSKYYRVAQNQQWKCPICGEHLFNGEELETHHIIPVKKGGSDDHENLQHLHKACHKQVHSGKTSKSGLK